MIDRYKLLQQIGKGRFGGLILSEIDRQREAIRAGTAELTRIMRF